MVKPTIFKGLQLTCFKAFLIVLTVILVDLRTSIAEELVISKQQSQALVEKAEVLEAEIQRHRQEVAEQPEDSGEYQSGFEDGYNKAILDLLKSKLLNDPSLSPKPKGAGLHAAALKHSNDRNRSAVGPSETVVPSFPAQVSVVGITPSGTVPAPATIGSTDFSSDSSSQELSAATPRERLQLTAEDWLEKTTGYLAEKNWQQAIDAATQAVGLDANLVDSYVVRSWAYAENGQHQKALADISTAISMDSDNALAYNNRAYIHELSNNRYQAQQDYQQACTLGYQPACKTVIKLEQALEQQRLANIKEMTDKSYRQFQQRDWQAVVKTTTALLELDSENTAALVNRAGAYSELGDYQKALDDCNAALILDPNMAIAYNNKGYVLELMGDLKKAAMEYETACVLGVQQSCGDFKRLSQQVSTLH